MAALLFGFRYFSCMFFGEQVSADVSAISTLHFHAFLPVVSAHQVAVCCPAVVVIPSYCFKELAELLLYRPSPKLNILIQQIS